MQIKNLTPHDINIVGENGEIRTFPKSGICARVSVETKKVFTVEGVEVMKETLGDVVDLPDEQDTVFLLVSRLVADAALKANQNRKDLLVPGGLMRNEAGQIIGCRGFITVVK